MWNGHIDAPRLPGDYPERQLDCEAALEAAFQNLMSTASASGWESRRIRRALRRLIAADQCEEEEEAKLEAYLAVTQTMERTRP